jgi:hypothetical protein
MCVVFFLSAFCLWQCTKILFIVRLADYVDYTNKHNKIRLLCLFGMFVYCLLSVMPTSVYNNILCLQFARAVEDKSAFRTARMPPFLIL